MPVQKFIEWLGFKKNIQAPPEVRAKFLLKYENLLVGTLSVEEGKWKFEYSEEFKQNGSLRPIVGFPDINKIYQSDELWQFFASRIPSPEQAEVEEILKRENIEEDDAVSLLKRFGGKTITNPFELEKVA
ncbi:MAG: HipA N-terminal domain-containing protein [Acidobacteria bacterium]|nr:HipA N-terminal domain-containing protein [Acidobacteriota bacterium]